MYCFMRTAALAAASHFRPAEGFLSGIGTERNRLWSILRLPQDVEGLLVVYRADKHAPGDVSILCVHAELVTRGAVETEATECLPNSIDLGGPGFRASKCPKMHAVIGRNHRIDDNVFFVGQSLIRDKLRPACLERGVSWSFHVLEISPAIEVPDERRRLQALKVGFQHVE